MADRANLEGFHVALTRQKVALAGLHDLKISCIENQDRKGTRVRSC